MLASLTDKERAIIKKVAARIFPPGSVLWRLRDGSHVVVTTKEREEIWKIGNRLMLSTSDLLGVIGKAKRPGGGGPRRGLKP